MKKTITILLLIAAITVPFLAFDVLPVIGDPASPPNTHVSDYYIEHAVSECNSPNIVTAVIVDYRAFDTMFETTVMFLAGLAVIMILANHHLMYTELVLLELQVQYFMIIYMVM